MAFGHHRDDFIVTLLKDYFAHTYHVQIGPYDPHSFGNFVAAAEINIDLLRSLVVQGSAGTMAAVLPLPEDKSLIRPLMFVPESTVLDGVIELNLPVQGSGCSHEVFTQSGRIPTTKREIIHANLAERLRRDPGLGDILMQIAVTSLNDNGAPLTNPRESRGSRLPHFEAP